MTRTLRVIWYWIAKVCRAVFLACIWLAVVYLFVRIAFSFAGAVFGF